MMRASMRGLVLLVLGLGTVLHGGCGGEAEKGHSAGTVPEAIAGVYMLNHPLWDRPHGAIILSRKGFFIVCAAPGANNAWHNMIGRWSVLPDGRLEMTSTHVRWSEWPNMGGTIPGCGSPSSPVVPKWKIHCVPSHSRIENNGFRWPEILSWPWEPPRGLCVRIPPPAWATGYLDFAVPDSARWGYDPSGKLAGTYTLDRERFAATLRKFGFADPLALAGDASVELELKPDGTCHWTLNDGWKTEEWRNPRTDLGLWLWHDAHLYFRGEAPDRITGEGSRVMRASIVDSRIYLEGRPQEYAEEGGATRDWHFQPPYELVRKKP